jgi:hypothetical protein
MIHRKGDEDDVAGFNAVALQPGASTQDTLTGFFKVVMAPW